jgi:hypothetical protein
MDEEQAAPSLASMAVRNPMFLKMGQQAAFNAVQQEEGDNELFNPNVSSPIDPSALDVDEKELAEIRKWSRLLKIGMLIIATLMVFTAYSNIGSSAVSLANAFLAIYLLFFSCLICCFEIAFKRVTVLLVQNFGFLYSAGGRFLFLSFVAVLCYGLSTLGKIVFALIIAFGFVYLYIVFKHPQLPKYLRAMHYYSVAKAKRAVPMVV